MPSAEDEFFGKFIAFDCGETSLYFGVDNINWFRPSLKEKVLRRLWLFGGYIDGMDFAVPFEDDEGSGKSDWKIVGAEAGERDLDEWIRIC